MNGAKDIYQRILSRKSEEVGFEELISRINSGEEIVSSSEMLAEMDAAVSMMIKNKFVKLDERRYELRKAQLSEFDLYRKKLLESSGDKAIVAAIRLGAIFTMLCEPDTLSQLSASRAEMTEMKRRVSKARADKKKIPGRALMSVLCEVIWQLEDERQLSTGQVAKEVFEIIKSAHDGTDLESSLPASHQLLEETLSQYSRDDLRLIRPSSPESLRKRMRSWKKGGFLRIPDYAEKSGPRG